MTKTTFNLTQAGRIIGKSRATIQRAIAKGKLSCELDENDSRVVRADELIRVYGQEAKFERAEGEASAKTATAPGPGAAELSPQLQKLQDQLLAQYRGEIERLEAALKRAQEGQNLVTGLIEDQRLGGQKWQDALDAQAEKIADRLAAQHNERLDQLEAKHDRELLLLKKTLHAERKKPLWRKLLG
jgi:hypothetical protein